MKRNYNYTRRKLFLPEYGRHIQEMVDSLLEIEDRHERTRQAKAVIAVMGNLNPLLRDTNGFKHKLWDHLFIMSDFQLDVDSPYPQPSRQDLMVVPQKLRYPQSQITFKHYGKYTQQFVRAVAAAQGSSDAVEELINIARYMRAKGYEFNNDHPNNEVIIRDINIMAGRDAQVDTSAISALRCDYRHNMPQRNNKNRKQSKPQQRNASGARRAQKGGAKGGGAQHHNPHK